MKLWSKAQGHCLLGGGNSLARVCGLTVLLSWALHWDVCAFSPRQIGAVQVGPSLVL